MSKENLNEEWRTIPGIETHEVSNLGNVRSKDRVSNVSSDNLGGNEGHRDYKRVLKGRMLKPNNTYIKRRGSTEYKQGYSYVSINNRTYTIHRLVAEAFIPNDANKPDINHLDGNKHNNRVDNLEWCTKSENEKHSYNVLNKKVWNKGIHFDTTNAIAVRNKNHLEKCKAILADRNSGMTFKQLSEKYGLCERQISDNLKKAKQ